MKTRQYAQIFALLAFAFLCLPAALCARTARTHASPHAARAQATHARTQSHASRKVRTAEPSHKQHPSLREARHTEDRHHKKHEHEVERLSVSRNRSRHETAPTLRPALASASKPALQTPVAIKATVAPPTHETGVSHPPDFDDVGPTPSATGPEPVVNILRRSPERPQIPSVEEEASTPEILPALYNKRGRLIMPPPLKGSHEILVHQNEVAERDGLERIQDDNDLERMRRLNLLVSLPVNAGIQVDDRLPYNRRYSRPWTAQFLVTLARAHYARFHTPLQINSAVRTVEFQQRLMRINGNAAPARGETASPHLTGQAVDIAKHGLSLSEIAWMRGYLLPLVQEGKIDVEEEFQQACFHISVYRRYMPSAPIPRRIVTTHRDNTATLALAIR